MNKISAIILIFIISFGGFLAIKFFKTLEPERLRQQGQSGVAIASLSRLKFYGEKGERLAIDSQELRLDGAIFEDNKAHFYNVVMPSGQSIYFFVVKDKNGIYRAAANACAVCFQTYKGFHQEGDEIVCNNCGNRYPIEKIATERGGCNPGPISSNLEMKDGKIIIKQADLESVSNLF